MSVSSSTTHTPEISGFSSYRHKNLALRDQAIETWRKEWTIVPQTFFAEQRLFFNKVKAVYSPTTIKEIAYLNTFEAHFNKEEKRVKKFTKKFDAFGLRKATVFLDFITHLNEMTVVMQKIHQLKSHLKFLVQNIEETGKNSLIKEKQSELLLLHITYRQHRQAVKHVDGRVVALIEDQRKLFKIFQAFKKTVLENRAYFVSKLDALHCLKAI